MVYLLPFWKSLKYLCGSVNFPASQELFLLRSKKQLHLLYATFFSSYYYETANFFMNPLLYLYQSAMTVSGTRWHLLSSDVFLDKCGFLRTQYCGHKQIKIVFYWIADVVYGVVYKSAGEHYWFAMSSTNPRCSLQIRGVIYQSAGVNLNV